MRCFLSADTTRIQYHIRILFCIIKSIHNPKPCSKGCGIIEGYITSIPYLTIGGFLLFVGAAEPGAVEAVEEEMAADDFSTGVDASENKPQGENCSQEPEKGMTGLGRRRNRCLVGLCVSISCMGV